MILEAVKVAGAVGAIVGEQIIVDTAALSMLNALGKDVPNAAKACVFLAAQGANMAMAAPIAKGTIEYIDNIYGILNGMKAALIPEKEKLIDLDDYELVRTEVVNVQLRQFVYSDLPDESDDNCDIKQLQGSDIYDDEYEEADAGEEGSDAA